jgi:outer membrane lipase/esterase
MNPADVVRNIEQAIVSLYRLGARNVVVLDLPDLGLIPANLIDENTSKAASAVSEAHNDALYPMVARLQTQYPQLHLILVELNPLFNDLRVRFGTNAPVPMIAAFAENPAMAACLFIDPVTCTDMPDFTFHSTLPFLFWDVVHPTTEAYRFLGDYMYNLLDGEYE